MSEARFRAIFSVFITLALRTTSHSYCTNTYGREVCSFVPAPPGKTPPCALPGLTYCERPDNYPGQRIQYLIQKWRLDHTTLLIDETKEDFSSYFYPLPTYGPPNNLKGEGFYPEAVYPYDQSTNVGNTYLPPRFNHTHGIFGYQNPHSRLEKYKYANDIPPNAPSGVYGPPNFYASLSLPEISPYVKVWNRKDEKFGKALLVRKRRGALVRSNLRRLKFLQRDDQKMLSRPKRQAAVTGQTLCETRSQFIMPRAALNNKGNWMYVVNMPELDNRFSQLVKSETCASQTCSGLCSLPLGYTSRCEQKYVQKRLIALEGEGNELYTDVFWFPSCCVCTLSNG